MMRRENGDANPHVGKPIDRPNASRYVGRVMTADVAQAVEALRAALEAVDELDQKVHAATTRAKMERYQNARIEARAALRQARADLDTVLLGPES